MLYEIVSELPLPQGKAYGLCDSWFTNKEVINVHFKKDNIQWIYDCTKRNIPIETIFKTMKIA